jgi:CheY-like chemotaxis protein
MKRRISVVEDNPDNRLLLQVLLGDQYDVTEHVDGFDAVAQIPLAPPDLVLLDVSLPGLDGPAVLKQLRAHSAVARVPIIALTAHAMTGDRERFLAAGFDDYVSKPIVDEQLLFEAIARQLPAA